jgi:hypothetical protein
MKGRTINGGTISRRHKLNLCELKLSMFLVFSNLSLAKNLFDGYYAENKLTSSKYSQVYYAFNNSK